MDRRLHMLDEPTAQMRGKQLTGRVEIHDLVQ